MFQEELAVLKRQHVTRSLPFSTDICGRSGGDVDDGSDHMSVEEENNSDAQNIKSLEDLKISNKQVICLCLDFLKFSLCVHFYVSLCENCS